MDKETQSEIKHEMPMQNSDVDFSENQGSDPESVGKQMSDSVLLPCRNGIRKKKHRRGKRHHRKWKPYNKMTWSERQEMDERETQRATQKREEAFASGHPRAPYNTTQFLMDDHIKNEPVRSPYIQEEVRHGKDPSTSCDSSEDYESTDEEKNFIAREFSETYDNIHAERLQSMPKESLIKEYIELESKLERAETKLKEKDNLRYVHKKSSDGSNEHYSVSSEEEVMDCEKRILRDELQRLLAENERLKAENEKLKKCSTVT